jgi:hypothetical protein
MKIYNQITEHRGFSTLTRTEIGRVNPNKANLSIYEGKIGQTAKTNKTIRLMQDSKAVFVEICRKIDRSEQQRSERRAKR